MCGVLGIAGPIGTRPSLDARAVAFRDRQTHRGPDGSGLHDGGHFIAAHSRLAIVDLSDAAAQPMTDPDAGDCLVYNGELYNDAELRAELAARGVQFRTQSDTETVMHVLRQWGSAGLERLRGMYALAYFSRESLLLARDPLGIKPLFISRRHRACGDEIVFASEPRSLTYVPWVGANPDIGTVSAYLTTIRPTFGRRTLFEGVLTLLPGECIEVDLHTPDLRATSSRVVVGASRWSGNPDVRSAVSDSVSRHLRSDVPVCVLLSGGLDSTIVASEAIEVLGPNRPLRSYCASATESSELDDGHFANLAAGALGTRHTHVPITREHFSRRWPEMIDLMGVPLSTPNEVAINAVARRLRADGCVVALSGEGADELFGGYETPLSHAAAHLALGNSDPGLFQLLDAAWITPDAKGAILTAEAWRAAECDEPLMAHYREEFARVAAERANETPLQAHLRFSRRINLEGLLRRLDSAMMLASVEGRTPFADVAVASLAESLPMRDKFDASGHGPERTKIALRRAYAGRLPREIVERPKASFPLPFQSWVSDHAEALRASPLARRLFTDAAIETVATHPERLWRLAWPMMNIAIWGLSLERHQTLQTIQDDRTAGLIVA